MKTRNILSIAFVLFVFASPCLAETDDPDSPNAPGGGGTPLARAINEAVHGIQPVEDGTGDRWARNPNNGIRIRFNPGGAVLLISPFGSEPGRESVSTAWRTTGIGYGNRIVPVPEGTLFVDPADPRRLEIRREGFTEWYVNRPEGIEHGYTLGRRPFPVDPDGGSLRLEIAMGGDLEARVAPDGNGVVLFDRDGRETVRYEKLKVWDSCGRDLVSRMRDLPGGLSLEIDDSGAEYPITIDPVFAQESHLKPHNTGVDDRFGFDVAIDGNTAVVGAPFEDGGALVVNGADDNNRGESGAAYVFVRNGPAWTLQAYLKPLNAGTNDIFGRSVAISGNTVIVGAFYEDGGSTGVNGPDNNNRALAGAAYVFVRNGSTWSQEAYLKAHNTGSNDYFGWSVAVHGNTAVVGAPHEDGGANVVNGINNDNLNQSGAAYVFVRSGSTWTQQSYLKPGNTDVGDQFGIDVAVDGDTVVVGANLEDSGSTGINGTGGNTGQNDSGAAYIFVRNGSAWTQQAYVKPHNTDSGDRFGNSVDVKGNLVVIGAPLEDSGSTGVNGPGGNTGQNDSGAAYIYLRDSGGWRQQAYLKAHNTDTGDQFGWGVSATTNNVSGDTVVVGAPYEDSGSTGTNGPGGNTGRNDSGAAYIFVRNGFNWMQLEYLKPHNTDTGDQFGFSVDVSGDFVALGAPFEDSDATGSNSLRSTNNYRADSGATFIFRVSNLPARIGIPKFLSFTPTKVRQYSAWKPVRITNTGGVFLTDILVSVAGRDRGRFVATRPPVRILAPGASTTIRVRFQPARAGRNDAMLTVRGDSPIAAAVVPANMKLIGTGVGR